MARLFVPENFDRSPETAGERELVDARNMETERLTAFERGYKAGWDDSVNAVSVERKAISADFAANLGDLAFTYHEARGHVLRQLESLVTETFAKVLPDCAQVALPHLVWAHVSRIAAEAADTPVTVLVAPGSRPIFESVLPADPGFPVTIVEEPTLTDGQVFIRSQRSETVIDQATALQEIAAAVRQFFEIHEQDEEGMRAHG